MEVPTVMVTPDDNDITKLPYKDTNLKNLETETDGLERASDTIKHDTSIVADKPMPEVQKTDTITPPQDELEHQQEVVTPETEDFERTVIAHDPRSTFTEMISSCVNQLPEADLN